MKTKETEKLEDIMYLAYLEMQEMSDEELINYLPY